jgi:hypothetical protein
MYRIRQQDLPLRGSSYNFVGADNGDVNVSVFLFRHFAPGGRLNTVAAVSAIRPPSALKVRST